MTNTIVAVTRDHLVEGTQCDEEAWARSSPSIEPSRMWPYSVPMGAPDMNAFVARSSPCEPSRRRPAHR